ncbi:malate dehydrogenase (quinone) [Brackiella oedipodis]|uniref:malate dehydrogenase (quinone) n=1 Tax=Brackiella oedipodis TaxID=124225 RepID=UPI00048FB871|nr:malate dehydrogenase (quinone) [Brackiella oedipodis]
MAKFLKYLLSLIVLVIVASLIFLNWPFVQPSVPDAENEEPVDVVLIGGGIMSVTLGTYLQELEPDWNIQQFEQLDAVGLESSNGWNNAGTGHSGYAELNYTPIKDGKVDITKAINTAEKFEVSRQFWAHQVKRGILSEPSDFINPTPHMSLVWGDDNIDFLKKRQAELVKNPLYYGMQISTDQEQIKQWAPLTMEGRDPQQKVAATYMPLGTDVNYGVITNQLSQGLKKKENYHLHLKHKVTAIRHNDDNTWNVTVKNLDDNKERTIKARFVFNGAGGAALKLLQLSGIPEANRYAGFPVGGQFLSFEDPAIAERHNAKVYGQAETGAPPMSVPHLDTRKLEGKQTILFGPFALYSTKFLKTGSWFDLFRTVNMHNVLGMWKVGLDNFDLVTYLVKQNLLDDDDRQKELLKYYPNAKQDTWRLITAGQRVQIIKKLDDGKTVLQFGTEVVFDKDHTFASLLGASPGASTSPSIMLSVLEKAFPSKMQGEWHDKILEIVPSYGQKVNQSPAYTNKIRRMTSSALHLPFIEVPENGELSTTPPKVENPNKSKQEGNLNTEMQAL